MKTMPRPQSNQDAFNNVWQWFIVDQHPRAFNDREGRCQYRIGTEACAIGCQLPDALVFDGIEGNSIQELFAMAHEEPDDDFDTPHREDAAKIVDWFSGVYPNLLWALQKAHDDTDRNLAGTLEDRLRTVALQYHLTIPGEGR